VGLATSMGAITRQLPLQGRNHAHLLGAASSAVTSF